jgi:hypothetical protein
MIRILTLLVSLFSFGLVQLAEINYEIPVTDMLYFNDTPISELNGLTLNELFIDSNLSNINTYFSILPTAQFQGRTENIFVTNTNQYYILSNFKASSPAVRLYIFNGSPSVTHNGDGTFQNLSIKATATSTYTQNSGVITFATSGFTLIEVNSMYFINLTSLGLTSLTKTELDRYYELWLNPELNITYEINELDTQDLVLLLASQSLWTIMIHLLYKYAYRPKKKSKRLGM